MQFIQETAEHFIPAGGRIINVSSIASEFRFDDHSDQCNAWMTDEMQTKIAAWITGQVIHADGGYLLKS